ncbi:MAG: Obg family GTPase CgtA [Desulfobaccales bacterium]
MKSFPDEAEITVQGGAGGAGCVSFRRARYQPRGRPDGGNGGRGGDVVLEASRHELTLAFFRRRRLFRAENGQPGQSQDCLGRNGAPLVICVPLGTLVYDADSGELLGELLVSGQRLVAARGGRGGKGNAHFASSRLRSPRFAQPGEKGEGRRLRLELQILADVGLVGHPNAGKTTLLRALTASKARVGDFPFTTLSPQLGVLYLDDEGQPLVLAEIPGLIRGAHLGRGLGHRFLRHLKRIRLLVMVIDVSQLKPDLPLAACRELEEELGAGDPYLLKKPRIIALNKIDRLPPDYPLTQVLKAHARLGLPVMAVSGLTGEGLPELRRAIAAATASLEAQNTPLTPSEPDFHGIKPG